MSILHRYFNCILLFLIYSIIPIDANSVVLKQDINWPEFMSHQDMIWEKLPEY